MGRRKRKAEHGEGGCEEGGGKERAANGGKDGHDGCPCEEGTGSPGGCVNRKEWNARAFGKADGFESALRCREGVFKVLNEVLRVFYADGDTQKVPGDAELLLELGRIGFVRHRGRAADEGFDAP